MRLPFAVFARPPGLPGLNARRLLPATALVFVAVAAVTAAVLPVSQWRDVASDMVASALYVVNWRFADLSVDYLAAEGAV